MESHSEDLRDRESARESLEAISADRGHIGERITAETWWAAPAQGLGYALIVAVPAAGLIWAWLLVALSAGILVGVEMLFRQRSGLGITRPAGPRGRWLLVAFSLMFLCSFAVSMLLTLFGQTGWVFALAAFAGIVTAIIGVAYDRVYAAEVCRAG